MIRRIIYLFLALVVCNIAYAGSKDIKLSSGNAKPIAIKDMKVRVEFDYSECQIYDMSEKKFFDMDEYMRFRGEDWVRDFPNELKKAEDAFVEEYNDESKTSVLVDSSCSSEYTVVFRLKEFSYGKNVIMFRSDLAWGTGLVELIKTDTREVIATYNFVKVQGKVMGGIGALELRRESCYEHVAEALAESINKLR